VEPEQNRRRVEKNDKIRGKKLTWAFLECNEIQRKADRNAIKISGQMPTIFQTAGIE
jgi:hypothetical protein